MGFYNNLCPGCMNEVDNAETCPYCGFDLTSSQAAPFLAYGTVIAGKYVIGDILEQNGEGVTYLGLDTITNNCVRVREFLPTGFCTRATDSQKVEIASETADTYKKYRSEFLDMWHKIMKLKNLESMITVLDVFEANDTAYAIAEADGSKTLAEYLTERTEPMTWDEIKQLVFPAADALEALHGAGVIHGAVSPETLFLCGNGKFKPWGFSIPETRKTEGDISPDIRPGYAAIEQYGNNDMTLSEATDVYGFVCVLYKCVTGAVPIDAEIRSKEDTLTIPAAFARELPEYVLAAFIGALQVLPGERTSDMAALKYSFTKQAFEKQNSKSASSDLVDPLSDIQASDMVSEKTESKKVVINKNPGVPVLTKTSGEQSKSSVASMVVLSLSIVAVMVIFFACLTMTGIVSFNVGGSGSSKLVEVPDFTNYNKDDAYISQVAEKYGLQIKLNPASSSTVASGVIFDQDIAPGTKIERGSNLVLTFSKGASTVELPNFVGMPFTETVYYLGRLNLSYNIVEKDNDGTKTAGQVATMTPAAGSIVYEGTEITIEIWGDPPASGDITGSGTGSEVTSSSSILDSIIGSLSDSVSGLGSTIQNFFN